MNFIGIDIGTTNVKIIETDNKLNILNKAIFDKDNPTSILEKFVNDYKINLNNIECIISTGIGSNMLGSSFDNSIKILEVPEFLSIANAGKHATKEKEYLVASIGTGTAFIKSKNGIVTHVGGTGIGGGSTINLCRRVIPNISFNDINAITRTNSLNNIDLHIKDVTNIEIKTLPKDITAVNLGKLNNNTTPQDLILGIVNMTFETIGVMAALAAKTDNIKQIIAIGQLVQLPFAREVFKKIELLHSVNILIPKNPEYSVALGGIIEYLEEKNSKK